MNFKNKIIPFVLVTASISACFAENVSSPHEFSVGILSNYYQYREPFLMSLKGYMVGGVFNYLYTAKNKYVFGVDLDLLGGGSKYNSNGTGSDKNRKQFKEEARLIFGRKFMPSSDLMLMPYTGFGIRHKSDFGGGKTTTTGHKGYNRHSIYYYLPVGLKMVNKLSNGWSIESLGEFDIFIAGRQKSKLLKNSGVPKQTLINKQKMGYGARGSVEVVKALGNNKAISFGPYLNYWNIKSSNRTPLLLNNKTDSMIEPRNNTIEVGLGIKYRF